jgi:hypothetical protein
MRSDKLRGTKWSRVQGAGLVHYCVRDVRRRAGTVTLVAVLDGSELVVPIEALQDPTAWEHGWRGGIVSRLKNNGMTHGQSE